MYNYGNLSDVEFEDLCKDIMSEKLGMELRTFTKGRDSGIDICDSVVNPEVVIQVKHFFKSSFSDLRRSLKDEKTKLKNIGKVNIIYVHQWVLHQVMSGKYIVCFPSLWMMTIVF